METIRGSYSSRPALALWYFLKIKIQSHCQKSSGLEDSDRGCYSTALQDTFLHKIVVVMILGVAEEVLVYIIVIENIL